LAAENRHYPVNRTPLRPTAFVALPVGAVKPEGWLKDQLNAQANGLTGHLDEFWPSLVGSGWKGASGESWERGPYYLDGLVPLAYVLDDPRLKEKVKPWIEGILASGKPDGWFGPAKNKDRWPLAVALKVLMQYHEATGDPRALEVIKNYFAWLRKARPDWPTQEWRGVRAMENVVAAYWLYRRTGDPAVLEVARSIHDHSYDWSGYFTDFPFNEAAITAKGYPFNDREKAMLAHVVNVAMAIKHPGVWYQQSGDARDREAVFKGLANLDQHHGQAGGRFSGDEHLSGLRPTQGTEFCGVVETMFSLENLVEVLGDVSLADRLETLAYNAQPGTCTPDYWAHQYDQQANQVLCSVAKRRWSSNSDTANLYGLEPHFGCCTANMHQGWPKFVAHLWMATHDQGLAAVAYGPSTVKAKVADGVEVSIREETLYPFRDAIEFTVSAPQAVEFPLHLRIPAWSEGAKAEVGGKTLSVKPGSFLVVKRLWQPGDKLSLTLPAKVRAETRFNDAVAIYRGPLLFSLKIAERMDEVKRHHAQLPVIDWAVRAGSPWNYALALDRTRPELAVKQFRLATPGKLPFAQETAPVVLVFEGRQLPEWQMKDNSAGDAPKSPVASSEPVTRLELIPYGCTRLRITEFPVLEP
jgi:hypothetical protein